MFEPRMMINKDERSEKIGTIVKYFRENRGGHTFYFLRFLMCEVLNFVNVIGQMFLMDKFLGGEFTTTACQCWATQRWMPLTGQTRWLWFSQRCLNAASS